MKHFILLKTTIHGQTNQDMSGDRSLTLILHLGLGDPAMIVADLESFHRERTDPAADTIKKDQEIGRMVVINHSGEKTTLKEGVGVSQDTAGGALGGETAVSTEKGNIHQKR